MDVSLQERQPLVVSTPHGSSLNFIGSAIDTIDIPFLVLLDHPTCLKHFRAFVSSESKNENFNCLTLLDDLRIINDQEATQKGGQIYESYFKQDSQMISIASTTVQQVHDLAKKENWGFSTFEPAYREIAHHLFTELYPNFLKTPAYKYLITTLALDIVHDLPSVATLSKHARAGSASSSPATNTATAASASASASAASATSAVTAKPKIASLNETTLTLPEATTAPTPTSTAPFLSSSAATTVSAADHPLKFAVLLENAWLLEVFRLFMISQGVHKGVIDLLHLLTFVNRRNFLGTAEFQFEAKSFLAIFQNSEEIQKSLNSQEFATKDRSGSVPSPDGPAASAASAQIRSPAAAISANINKFVTEMEEVRKKFSDPKEQKKATVIPLFAALKKLLQDVWFPLFLKSDWLLVASKRATELSVIPLDKKISHRRAISAHSVGRVSKENSPPPNTMASSSLGKEKPATANGNANNKTPAKLSRDNLSPIDGNRMASHPSLSTERVTYGHLLYKDENEKLSLNEILADADLYKLFLSFCKSEHSEEDVLFYDATATFKKGSYKDSNALLLAAKKIREEFVKVDSLHEIMLSVAMRTKIQSDLEAKEIELTANGEFSDQSCAIMLDMFSQAQKVVMHLIRADSYVRFVSSKLYKDAMQKRKAAAMAAAAAAAARREPSCCCFCCGGGAAASPIIVQNPPRR